nr:hypothetical protein 34 [Fulvia fulva]
MMPTFITRAVIHSLFAFSSAQAQQQYKQPAPVYVIQPDPQQYIDWQPTTTGQGDFRDRNTSVTPWQPSDILAALLDYPRPEACGVDASSSQQDFWLADFEGAHQGSSPFLVSGHYYHVFRNVRDYGAKGDGKTDDTDAFNRAITDESRMGGGMGSGGSTGQPALIWIPSGTYMISSSVQLFIGTQVIGDPLDKPVIRLSSIARNGTTAIDGYDFGQPSTNNFYIGLRNVIIDTTKVAPNATVYGLNWAVSQATNLINVDFRMPADSSHIGIQMDGSRGGGDSGGGSGLFMGDLTFEGGLIGILFNNQQYAIKNCNFTNVGTGIAVKHAFVLNLQGIHCKDVGICVDAGGNDITGSVGLIDSTCDTCGTVVNGSSQILLENIAVKNSGPTLKINGKSRGISDLIGKTYVDGHVYDHPDVRQKSTGNTTITPVASNGTFLDYTERGSLTGADGRYFTKRLPQYEDLPASAFASIKECGARGDGVTDDTKAIQQALNSNAGCKITYFPHGVYLVTDTIYIPPGSRIVGQVWSTITASGKHFSDEKNPQPMIQVGKKGEVGLVEITDMLFTVSDVLPGTILVQVNMRGENQGDVSFHNTHFRIGGAVDTRLETACQEESKPCKAAFMVVHLTKQSSSYWENSWLWTADHDLDGKYNQQIGTGRGMYVEAREGTWLLGTGSEHHTLYAYQFQDASNVFAALMQVESPYWQPVPQAPAPWTPDSKWNDPDFSSCEQKNVTQCYMQWALRIVGKETHTLALYGQGNWVFFNGPNYGGLTLDGGVNGQVNIVDLQDLSRDNNVAIYNLNTKSVQNMITLDGGSEVVATSAANSGSWGGVIAAYLV